MTERVKNLLLQLGKKKLNRSDRDERVKNLLLRLGQKLLNRSEKDERVKSLLLQLEESMYSKRGEALFRKINIKC